MSEEKPQEEPRRIDWLLVIPLAFFGLLILLVIAFWIYYLFFHGFQ